MPKSTTSRLPLFLRLLRNQVKTISAFVFLFSIGMSLFLTVDTMSIEFEDGLNAQSKMFIGGDVELQLRRDFSPSEKDALSSIFDSKWKSAEEWRFFTMLSGPEKTLLVQSRAVGQNFPLVGEFSDSTGQVKYPAPPQGEVYIPESLLKVLGVSVGDSIQVGTSKFLISKVLVGAPDSRFAFAQFTQRFYMNLEDVVPAGLSSKGSRIFRHYHYLALGKIADSEILQLKKNLLTKLSDPEIKVETSIDADTELTSRFAMAISLAKLLSLFTFLMAALGALQFFFNHLDREKENRILFQSLGMPEKKIADLYFWQGFFLTLLAVVASAGFSLFWTQQISSFLTQQFQIEINGSLRFDAVVLLLVASIGTYVLLIIGPLIQLNRETAHSQMNSKGVAWKLSLSLFMAQLGFGFLLSWLVTHSWILSGIFLVLLIVGFGGMSFAVWCMDRLIQFLHQKGLRWNSWQSLRLLVAHRPAKSILVYCLIGLVTLVLYLMPGLNSMLSQQLMPGPNQSLPKWFMIDLQEYQLPELEVFLKSKGYEEFQASPMIRARLLKINGENFVRTQKGESLEAEQERRMRNRGYNLSFRDSLASSETIKEGKFWTSKFNGEGLPELSVESRFMSRLGFEMGDTLEFEIEGFPVKGYITSVREIRWSSFQPNFFVQFQPGVLEMAPKTFILSLPALTNQDPVQFQKEFFDAFPTVSLVDLQEVVEVTITQLERISIILTGITGFALLCGLILLLEIAFELSQSAKKEMHIRLCLGQGSRSILWLWLGPIYSWVLSAWLIGYGLHIVFVYAIGDVIFGNLPWVPDLKTFLLSLPVVLFFFGAIYVFFHRALFHEKTLTILKSKD